MGQPLRVKSCFSPAALASLPRASQTSGAGRSGQAAALNCAAIVNDVWVAAGRKCWLLPGRVRELFLGGMAQWRVLGRKLEGHPAHTGHLQRTADSQDLWEKEKDHTDVKSLLSPERGQESPPSPLLNEDVLRGASERKDAVTIMEHGGLDSAWACC